MTEHAILLSVQPKYAEKIVAGQKTAELRKTRLRVHWGDLVIIYASSPVMGILGSSVVDHVITCHPRKLWPIVKEAACISRREFDQYYDGFPNGTAIFFSNAWRAKEVLKLNKIRELCPKFRPPQRYQYLASMDERIKILISSVASQNAYPSQERL